MDYTKRNKSSESYEDSVFASLAKVPKAFEIETCPYCKKSGTLLHMGYAKRTHQYFEILLYQLANDSKTLMVTGYGINVYRSPYSL